MVTQWNSLISRAVNRALVVAPERYLRSAGALVPPLKIWNRRKIHNIVDIMTGIIRNDSFDMNLRSEFLESLIVVTKDSLPALEKPF